ncbi:MAG: hypothetical protein ACE5IR_16820 [bacterium]
MLSSIQNFKNTQNKPKLPDQVRERIRTEKAYEWILYRSFWDTTINAVGLMDQWIVGLQSDT